MQNLMNTDFVITDITLAVYVENGQSEHVHTNRKNHGIAINKNDAAKVYVFDGNKVIKLNKNEMIYLPKNSSYKVYSESSGDCYAFNFELYGDFSYEPFSFKPKNLNTFLQRFEKASILWKNKKDSYRMQCMVLLYEVFLLMQGESAKDYISGDTASLIRPAIDYIHNNYTNPGLKISDLSKICSISEDYFRRIFRKRYKTSPVKYVNDLRYKYAKELLSSTEMPVAKIAELSGFIDPAYFCREFKKRFGITPSEYR